MSWNREEVKKKVEELFPDFSFDESTPSLTASINIVDDKTDIKVNAQPLFTLTPEEVIIVNHFLTCDKNKLEKEEKSFENDLMINDLNQILNRIKQYQNETLYSER